MTITRLVLFVHPIARSAAVTRDFMPRWEQFIAQEAQNPATALCILVVDLPGATELNAMGERYFGERCVIDPFDYGNATKVLIADDLQRLLRGRGMRDEWAPQEIWSSYVARRWSEGLKKRLGERGYGLAAEPLEVIACGREWGGCLTKYPMLMTRYLGATRAPRVRVDLSPYAGMPYQGTFCEHIALDRHVQLYLFTTPGGRPFAHYVDGLRAIWEAPHMAVISANADAIETVIAPLGRDMPFRTDGVARVGDHLHVDVIDGCRPARVTLFARGLAFDDFRQTLAAARIEPKCERAVTNYGALGGQNPIAFASEDEAGPG